MTCTSIRAVGVVRNIWKVKLIGFTDTLDVGWEEKKKKTPEKQQWLLGFWPEQLEGWSCHKLRREKLQEEQFWARGGDQKFGLTKLYLEMPIRYLTGETNYNNILPTAVVCSVLSFSTRTISLIAEGLLCKHGIKQVAIPESPEDNSSRIGEISHYVWVCLWYDNSKSTIHFLNCIVRFNFFIIGWHQKCTIKMGFSRKETEDWHHSLEL